MSLCQCTLYMYVLNYKWSDNQCSLHALTVSTEPVKTFLHMQETTLFDHKTNDWFDKPPGHVWPTVYPRCKTVVSLCFRRPLLVSYLSKLTDHHHHRRRLSTQNTCINSAICWHLKDNRNFHDTAVLRVHCLFNRQNGYRGKVTHGQKLNPQLSYPSCIFLTISHFSYWVKCLNYHPE